MLAKLVRELPVDPELAYEPKWDGFRCLVFRDGDDVELSSRNGRSLTRYFPEMIEPLRARLPAGSIVDGELVIAGPSGLDFDLLQARIHPAASRVATLSVATPATFIAFDLLAIDSVDVQAESFADRRSRLVAGVDGRYAAVRVTPLTTDPAVARDWFSRFEGAGLDGVVAKYLGLSYQQGARVMLKVKHERTADCVVGGYRLQNGGTAVASLLLGLYDAAGNLHHIGVTSSFTAARRRALRDELAVAALGAGESHPWEGQFAEGDATRRPGAPSRWNASRDLSFVALRPELVCEIAYDQLQGNRLRHNGTFRRWRPDRDPASCTYDQLEVVVPAEVGELFSGPR
jgi:ATP-dependent DNA ligase